MRKLSIFNFVSLDGYYKGANEDISWNRHGPEEAEFSTENLRLGNTLLFGRVTYQMMKSFWTTPEAMASLPEVATRMNEADKLVFSNTLTEVDWRNTSLVCGELISQIKTLKAGAGSNMTILGSGSIVTQLANENLIDEYQVMIYPVAIGKGTSIFANIKQQLNLTLTGTRVFKSGTVLLTYQSKI